ncbi:hypothetical protein COCNU_16G002850 [Cocos nucifera]|uniref:Uncharacterized protein n=1 Tax=Cocos nucifera TaxID=13894 RepID=A0A8K0IXZ4_COCNU|nr:hypothetical protein COCNU_16G002850 [Cocos nucifera]
MNENPSNSTTKGKGRTETHEEPIIQNAVWIHQEIPITPNQVHQQKTNEIQRIKPKGRTRTPEEVQIIDEFITNSRSLHIKSINRR